MKGFFATFHLTPGEQRVVIFSLIALLAWTWLKDREVNYDSAVSNAAPPMDSLTPNEP